MPSSNHPISDDESDILSTLSHDSLSVNKGGDKTVVTPAIAPTDDGIEKDTKSDENKGFAASYAEDSGIGTKIRDDIAATLNFALREKLEDKKINDTISKHKQLQIVKHWSFLK